MSEKTKIGILGIGGVGGYFGGKLAKYFAESDDLEIIFIARGENAKAIQTNGLKVITTNDEFIAKPNMVSTDPSEIGVLDYFVICTKAYDLEESISKYRDCIGEETVILPLLNGVNHAETIQKILPNAEVWNGCVFIVAKLQEAGIVKIDSEIRLLQFGSPSGNREKLERFAEIQKEAGVDFELSKDIDKTIWEKFIFISSLATITSFTDKHVGEVVKSPEYMKLVEQLLAEVTNLARAKNINVAENIEEIASNRIRSSPPESTSSMHNDFKKKGKTELETLTGYVVREAETFGIEVPTYGKLYAELQKR
jgi:2-dehydropantoate 2-reductase